MKLKDEQMIKGCAVILISAVVLTFAYIFFVTGKVGISLFLIFVLIFLGLYLISGVRKIK